MSNKAGWKFYLDGRSYSWQKADRQGNCETPDNTKVQVLSWLLKQHFYPVKKFINKSLKGKDDAPFAVRSKLIFNGLRDVGKFFSLKRRKVKPNEQLLWLALTYKKTDDGKRELNPFIEWRILDCTSKDKAQNLSAKRIGQELRDGDRKDAANRRFQRLEKKSKALLRVAIVVYRNTWTLVPAKIRRDDD